MAENEHLQTLFTKYVNNTLSKEEYQQLLQYFRIDKETANIAQLLYDAMATETPKPPVSQETLNQVMDNAQQRIQQRIRASRSFNFKRYRWLFRAAALLVIGFGTYFLVRNPSRLVGIFASLREVGGTAHITDIAPGYNQATMTLADGSTINLDSAHNGIIVTNADIKYSNGNRVQSPVLPAAPKSGRKKTSLSNSLISLTTPRGGQYQIVLPDGTKVWLNSGTTLKYPNIFNNHKREVILEEGEAYFVVANEGLAPFIVKTRDQEIVVLGTEFNISAFSDEEMVKTTLVSGAVQIYPKGTTAALLKPGEQFWFSGKKLGKRSADVNSEIAWKNGFFSFKDENIQAVMSKLARWYNMEVIYEGKPPAGTFSGEIGRDLTLSQVLKGLSATRIKYKIAGKKLIIINDTK